MSRDVGNERGRGRETEEESRSDREMNGGEEEQEEQQDDENDDDNDQYIFDSPDDKRHSLIIRFYKDPTMKKLAAQVGLNDKLFRKACTSLRLQHIGSDRVHLAVDDVELYTVLDEMLLDPTVSSERIFPFFKQHAMSIFPHMSKLEELRDICDLTQPELWYERTRTKSRKIVYHAGPTNSGKTYNALKRWRAAKSGVYCSPLKLLAVEVYENTHFTHRTPCDLITGDERRFSRGVDGKRAEHVACTVEMTFVDTVYDVAVIDEIQNIRDSQRGWAWTRALLGVCAAEVHVCGEESTIDLIRELAKIAGDTFEVIRYKRLTDLDVLGEENECVDSFDEIQDGDCIVAFSKNEIYKICTKLAERDFNVSVVYGTLPPGTKEEQAARFNNSKKSGTRGNVLVATDAIGMGLNLNIKRMIFYHLCKLTKTEDGERVMRPISTSLALQIAGRAGRFKSRYPDGEVTCFDSRKLPQLHKILFNGVPLTERAGLHPTEERIELFANHLRDVSFYDLPDVIESICKLDTDRYFMCDFEDFRYHANLLKDIHRLKIHERFYLCIAPMQKYRPFIDMMFKKFAHRCSTGKPLTVVWLCEEINCPVRMPSENKENESGTTIASEERAKFKLKQPEPCIEEWPEPRTVEDLEHLEEVFDVLSQYLWLSYRFVDMFPNMEIVRVMQQKLDKIIKHGVNNITTLIHESYSTSEQTGSQQGGKAGDVLADNKVTTPTTNLRLIGEIPISQEEEIRADPEMLHERDRKTDRAQRRKVNDATQQRQQQGYGPRPRAESNEKVASGGGGRNYGDAMEQSRYRSGYNNGGLGTDRPQRRGQRTDGNNGMRSGCQDNRNNYDNRVYQNNRSKRGWPNQGIRAQNVPHDLVQRRPVHGSRQSSNQDRQAGAGAAVDEISPSFRRTSEKSVEMSSHSSGSLAAAN